MPLVKYYKRNLTLAELKDHPIHDNNVCVCSHHFTEQDFVSSVVEGFGSKRPTLKPDEIPMVLCFSQPVKHRKLSKTREVKALHRSIIDDLLAGPYLNSVKRNLKQSQETLEYNVFIIIFA